MAGSGIADRLDLSGNGLLNFLSYSNIWYGKYILILHARILMYIYYHLSNFILD